MILQAGLVLFIFKKTCSYPLKDNIFTSLLNTQTPNHITQHLQILLMMRWGRKKPVSSSSSSSSWFSKLSVSSDLKPAKEKKQDEDEASKNMSRRSSLSSTIRRNDVQESNKSIVEKKNIATRSRGMESNEKFEVIMSSVRKKVRDFHRETLGFLEVEVMEDRDKGTVFMTPRIQVNRDKQRYERRDQRLLEQKSKISEQASRTSTGSKTTVILGQAVTKPIQKLKEIKVREVKLKADQRRKSLYLKRETNRLGTKDNSNNKVRVFSPRASEKCRVKAIEDLKKAKLRAREPEPENESFAVVKCSSDPQKDFRDSMIEMIMENGINQPEELKELLVCYIRLNSKEYHDMIINVFQQVHHDIYFH